MLSGARTFVSVLVGCAILRIIFRFPVNDEAVHVFSSPYHAPCVSVATAGFFAVELILFCLLASFFRAL